MTEPAIKEVTSVTKARRKLDAIESADSDEVGHDIKLEVHVIRLEVTGDQVTKVAPPPLNDIRVASAAEDPIRGDVVREGL